MIVNFTLESKIQVDHFQDTKQTVADAVGFAGGQWEKAIKSLTHALSTQSLLHFGWTQAQCPVKKSSRCTLLWEIWDTSLTVF